MYHLKTQTITEQTTSKVSNTCICQYIPFVGIGSKLQMVEARGITTKKSLIFQSLSFKSTFKVYLLKIPADIYSLWIRLNLKYTWYNDSFLYQNLLFLINLLRCEGGNIHGVNIRS